MKHMWKTFIQGHVDFCSQLWQPVQSGEMQRVENIQKTYTKKIPTLSHLNYWDRLNYLKINSQQRRLERYRIICVWKIMQGLAPNCGLEWDENDLRGRMFKLQKVIQTSSQANKTLREQSFHIHGCKLFNKIPALKRNKKGCNINKFKEKLDIFLSTIPDQPVIGNLISATCNPITLQPSDSILDLAPLLGRDLRRNPGQ